MPRKTLLPEDCKEWRETSLQSRAWHLRPSGVAGSRSDCAQRSVPQTRVFTPGRERPRACRQQRPARLIVVAPHETRPAVLGAFVAGACHMPQPTNSAPPHRPIGFSVPNPADDSVRSSLSLTRSITSQHRVHLTAHFTKCVWPRSSSLIGSIALGPVRFSRLISLRMSSGSSSSSS